MIWVSARYLDLHLLEFLALEARLFLFVEEERGGVLVLDLGERVVLANFFFIEVVFSAVREEVVVLFLLLEEVYEVGHLEPDDLSLASLSGAYCSCRSS